MSASPVSSPETLSADSCGSPGCSILTPHVHHPIWGILMQPLSSERPTLSQSDADALINAFEKAAAGIPNGPYNRARAALRAALLREKP